MHTTTISQRTDQALQAYEELILKARRGQKAVSIASIPAFLEVLQDLKARIAVIEDLLDEQGGE